MINEKKLIEALEKYHNGWKPSYITKLLESVFLDIKDIINEQPKVGEWIPCSERLPEVDKTSEYYDAVNVTLDDGRVVNGCYVNIDKEWWVDAEDGEKHSINATGHVLAWMPLPEPYREKVQDGKID